MFLRAQSDRYPAIIDMIQTDCPMVANSLIDQVSSCFRELSDRYPAIIDMIQTDSPMVANSLLIDQVSSCFRELRVIDIWLTLIY